MTLERWGLCQMFDSDHQWCVLKAGHKGGHQDTGLRHWLQSTTDESIMRTYNGAAANSAFQSEVALFAEFDFHPTSQSGTSGTTGPGMGSILALGILAFGRRTSYSTISVLFRRDRPSYAPAAQQVGPTISEQIQSLAQLRDGNLLTDQEFDAAKAQILSRA